MCLQLSIADMPVAIKMNRFIYGAHDGLKIFLNSISNCHIPDLNLKVLDTLRLIKFGNILWTRRYEFKKEYVFKTTLATL